MRVNARVCGIVRSRKTTHTPLTDCYSAVTVIIFSRAIANDRDYRSRNIFFLEEKTIRHFVAQKHFYAVAVVIQRAKNQAVVLNVFGKVPGAFTPEYFYIKL